MGDRLAFDLGFGVRGGVSPRPRAEGAPFRLLLVGNFSGRGAGGGTPIGRALPIDAGDVDLAVKTMKAALPIAVDGAAEEVAQFESLEDFHPDALFQRLALFREPRKLRAALAAPAPTADALAAAEGWLRGQMGGGAAAAVPVPAAGGNESSGGAESADATVARLLGRNPGAGAAPSAPAAAFGRETADSVVAALIEKAVRPHVTPDLGARRALVLGAFDELLTSRMRAVLFAPAFRALEAAWRGVDRVARALDTDGELKIALLDAGAADLRGALPAPGGDLTTSDLHRAIAGDDRGWSLVAVDLAFDRVPSDLKLLAALGAVAARAGGALLADAAPGLLGASTPAELAALDPRTDAAGAVPAGSDPAAAYWIELRGSPLAPTIALGFPRVLARLPYGKKTDPITSFAFEELPSDARGLGGPRLWGSAAFALAQACGAGFRADGWQLDPDAAFDLGDLPAHTFDDGGESRLVPPTEVALGERAALALTARGASPWLTRPDRAEARLLGLSSIALPRTPLSGPWTA